MAPPQPALRSVEPHIHPFTETCPTCEQPIPNEKAQEIRERVAERERRLNEAADARAAKKYADEKAQIEAAAQEKVDQAERATAEAVKKANDEATVRSNVARAEGRQSAETAAAQKVADAEKAKADAERAKSEVEAAAARKVADAENAAKTQKEEAQKQLDTANAKVKQTEAARDAAVEARGREVREAMEKDKAEALATAKAAKDAEMQKLSAELDGMKRQLEKQRAAELGEGAHINLLDALKAAFPGDNIRRVRPGASGADILHTALHNGQECGTIIYESKNTTRWLDDYVTKLVRDQTAAQADHAILATLAFPPKASQVEIRSGVMIVNPARAVAIAQILRKHLLHVHTLRLSKSERVEKMASLYDFMTSERYRLLTGRLDTDSEALLKLQEDDKRYHDNHWRKEGLLIVSQQKVKAEIDTVVELIIGGSETSDSQ